MTKHTFSSVVISLAILCYVFFPLFRGEEFTGWSLFRNQLSDTGSDITISLMVFAKFFSLIACVISYFIYIREYDKMQRLRGPILGLALISLGLSVIQYSILGQYVGVINNPVQFVELTLLFVFPYLFYNERGSSEKLRFELGVTGCLGVLAMAGLVASLTSLLTLLFILMGFVVVVGLFELTSGSDIRRKEALRMMAGGLFGLALLIPTYYLIRFGYHKINALLPDWGIDIAERSIKSRLVSWFQSRVLWLQWIIAALFIAPMLIYYWGFIRHPVKAPGRS